MRLKYTLIRCLSIALALTIPSLAQEKFDKLKDQIAAQQKQIEDLRRTLESQQRMIEDLTASVHLSQSAPPLIASTSTAAIASAVQQSQLQRSEIGQPRQQSSPLSFRIGDAEFTPGGFMDMTSVWRSTNVGSGIGTSFGGIPFNNTVPGETTESRFSAQNSRIAMRVDAKAKGIPVTGYVEADFLGALPANAHVSSNSNSLRMRLYWVQVRPGKWEVLGGQSWSMMTPGRTGISPNPGDIFYTQDMDTNYQVGLTWTRATQFRVLYHASNGFHIGFALENPQQYTTAAAVLPAFATGQVDPNGNTNAPNLHPDVQAKIAYDAKPGGHSIHFEAGGVFRSFRILRPDLSSSSIQGGGGEFNGNFEVIKNFRILFSSFASTGGGRYVFGLGPDFVVRANGDLSPIHTYSGIAGFEYQASPSSMITAYYGAAYFGRNFSTDPATGKFLGYGFPGSPNTNNRTIGEYTVGYIHTFWKNPNYGSLQLINQYSYLVRSPWANPASGPIHAHTHMLFNDLRFVLP